MNIFKHDSKGRFSSFKVKSHAFSRAFIKRLAVGYSIYALMFLVAVVIDSQVRVHVVNAETIEAVQVDPPVMQRIAKCESSTGMKGKSGQVQVKVNTNGSVDVGKFQINSIHFAEATKLGFDIFTEKGNHDYAMYLYQNYGTGAWSSSAKCWNK